jgi:eukaryotic-like serine/threonine-protein kinase
MDVIGRTLAHFQVTSKLGEGGMGEVYRASDVRLARDVAIKVLPDVFTNDPERLARFQREARVLAALNHPNIAAIYGLEEADGKHLLVLELAEGDDLTVRIGKGPMPLEEALPIAVQIA